MNKIFFTINIEQNNIKDKSEFCLKFKLKVNRNCKAWKIRVTGRQFKNKTTLILNGSY